MQPILAVATLVAAVAVAVNSETAYLLAPVQPRILQTGWGWRPVKTVSLSLPSITRGWGWKSKLPSSINIGIYGGLKIGPGKQQGWGQKQQGWGWQPQKQQGWGWGQQQQQQGWGWKQQGWGWHGGDDDDDDDEDDYRAETAAVVYDDGVEAYDDDDDASSEEVADDEGSASAESDEQDSLEDDLEDSPYDMRNAFSYEPVYV